MRVFQAAGFGQSYLGYFNARKLQFANTSFDDRLQHLLADRYDATHILQPVYDRSPDIFFTVCDDSILQLLWARAKGMATRDLTAILLAQIEEFRPDVLYQLDPIGYPSSFVRALPSGVKTKIAWRAAPMGGADLSAYDLVVSNFETLNARWRKMGLRTGYFFPSWDPQMDSYGRNGIRPVDVFFAGSYARTTGHDERLQMLEAVAKLSDLYQIDLRLMVKKWGRLADKPLIRWIPFPILLPPTLKTTSRQPVFGLEMYSKLSQAKIVLNPATAIAGQVRGNMRCWEAMGCGSCMLASAGQYPEGFEAGVNFEAYTNTDDLVKKIKHLLADDARRAAIGHAAANMIARVWSKERQWQEFRALL